FVIRHLSVSFFFVLTGASPAVIYTLSLHDALPICWAASSNSEVAVLAAAAADVLASWAALITAVSAGGDGHEAQPLASISEPFQIGRAHGLNSSHVSISYAVFCLKNKSHDNRTTPI